MRIEDVVLVTDDGHEVISTTPKTVGTYVLSPYGRWVECMFSGGWNGYVVLDACHFGCGRIYMCEVVARKIQRKIGARERSLRERCRERSV